MINLNFNVSRKDAAMFITSIEYVINNTANQTTRKRLFKILKEIKFDYWKDDKIFLFVAQMLQQETREPIYLNSNLKDHLSILDIWISRTMYKKCNNIIVRLMHLSGKKKPFQAITRQQAGQCKTVRDIVNLIRTTYDKA